jgi:3'-phosphoadenosine 5'-phosphosulfate (PAPS) 3'-phosphatase
MEYLLAGQEQKPLNATPSVPPVSKTKPAAFPSISLDQSDSIAASNKKIKKLLEDCKYEYSFIVDEIHDVAAGMLLVQEAGEVVTSFQGEAVNPPSQRESASSPMYSFIRCVSTSWVQWNRFLVYMAVLSAKRQ